MATPPPRMPDPARRLDAYSRGFAVVVICPDEATQTRVYEGLRALAGVRLRVVAT